MDDNTSCSPTARTSGGLYQGRPRDPLADAPLLLREADRRALSTGRSASVRDARESPKKSIYTSRGRWHHAPFRGPETRVAMPLSRRDFLKAGGVAAAGAALLPAAANARPPVAPAAPRRPLVISSMNGL